MSIQEYVKADGTVTLVEVDDSGPCPDCGGTGLIYCRTAEDGHAFGPETCGCMDDDEEPAMTPTQPPAPTGATARDVIATAVSIYDSRDDHTLPGGTPSGAADAILAALAEAGYVIVERDNLEMAVEWMDQTENPWSGSETFAETWTAALVAQYELKDVIHEFYAARQPEGVRDGE